MATKKKATVSSKKTAKAGAKSTAKAKTTAVSKKKTTKKAAPKKAAAKKPASKKTAAKKTVTKKAVAKKAAPKKAAKAKPAPKKTAAKKPAAGKSTAPSTTKATKKSNVTKKTTAKAATTKKKATKDTAASSKPIAYKPNPSLLDTPQTAYTPGRRYSDADLQEFKELIQEKLEAARKEVTYLQGLITRKGESGTDDTESKFMGVEDGSGTMEREQLSQLASRQIQYIDHLEKALMRIENKTYGICRVTGKLIDKKRLRAVPHATLSIEAKQARK